MAERAGAVLAQLRAAPAPSPLAKTTIDFKVIQKKLRDNRKAIKAIECRLKKCRHSNVGVKGTKPNWGICINLAQGLL